MICDDCSTTSQPTRDCAICGETMCRHDARKQRTEDGVESIVCKDPWPCVKRVGAVFRRENDERENTT